MGLEILVKRNLYCTIRNQFSAAATGTSESMKNISQDIIKNTLIPLPPLDEQKRIVEKLEQLLPLCERLK